jgi:hypothetical protein
MRLIDQSLGHNLGRANGTGRNLLIVDVSVFSDFILVQVLCEHQIPVALQFSHQRNFQGVSSNVALSHGRVTSSQHHTAKLHLGSHIFGWTCKAFFFKFVLVCLGKCF